MADDWAIYQALWQSVTTPTISIDERRLRLWVAGCCRMVLAHFEDQSHLIRSQIWFTPSNCAGWRHEVTVAERFADGEVDTLALVNSRHAKSGGPYNLFHLTTGLTRLTSEGAAETLTEFSREFGVPTGVDLICLFRDVFGMEQQRCPFAPEWRSSSVIGLAQSMYESREFSPMPILADALEEAGCDHADILSHCRGDGPHVRGCWVVDLVLGKA